MTFQKGRALIGGATAAGTRFWQSDLCKLFGLANEAEGEKKKKKWRKTEEEEEMPTC